VDVSTYHMKRIICAKNRLYSSKKQSVLANDQIQPAYASRYVVIADHQSSGLFTAPRHADNAVVSPCFALKLIFLSTGSSLPDSRRSHFHIQYPEQIRPRRTAFSCLSTVSVSMTSWFCLRLPRTRNHDKHNGSNRNDHNNLHAYCINAIHLPDIHPIAAIWCAPTTRSIRRNVHDKTSWSASWTSSRVDKRLFSVTPRFTVEPASSNFWELRCADYEQTLRFSRLIMVQLSHKRCMIRILAWPRWRGRWW